MKSQKKEYLSIEEEEVLALLLGMYIAGWFPESFGEMQGVEDSDENSILSDYECSEEEI